MYGKLFSEIFDSTLAAEGGWLPTYIFMSMVTIADQEGVVDVAPKALYSKLALTHGAEKVTYEQFTEALDFLCSPDDSSKSAARNGRRIVPMANLDDFESNRGFWIVNYLDYRLKGSKEDKLAKDAARSKRYRDRQKSITSAKNVTKKRDASVTDCDESRESRHTDSDTDSDTGRGGRDLFGEVSQPPPVPYENILALYHDLTTLPRVRVYTDKRKRQVRARWKEHPDLEWWRKFFVYVESSSKFLHGGNDRGWTADFEWLTNPTNLAKVIEGKYEDEEKS